MPITRTTMIDDDGSGTTGTILNNAWLQTIYDQIDGIVQGDWIDIPFVAGDFTVSPSGSWTVSTPNVWAYQISGKTMIVALYATGWTIGGAPVSLNFKLPGAYSHARPLGQTFAYSHGGGAGTGWAVAELGGVKLHTNILGTPWVAGTSHLSGVFIFNVN